MSPHTILLRSNCPFSLAHSLAEHGFRGVAETSHHGAPSFIRKILNSAQHLNVIVETIGIDPIDIEGCIRYLRTIENVPIRILIIRAAQNAADQGKDALFGANATLFFGMNGLACHIETIIYFLRTGSKGIESPLKIWTENLFGSAPEPRKSMILREAPKKPRATPKVAPSPGVKKDQEKEITPSPAHSEAPKRSTSPSKYPAELLLSRKDCRYADVLIGGQLKIHQLTCGQARLLVYIANNGGEAGLTYLEMSRDLEIYLTTLSNRITTLVRQLVKQGYPMLLTAKPRSGGRVLVFDASHYI